MERTRLHWLWLAESELHNQKGSLLQRYGTIDEIYRACVVERSGERKLRWYPTEEELQDKWEQYQKRGIHFCCCEEKDYPTELGEIYGAPGWLYYKGKLPEEERRIAVVGARACTPHGVALTERICRELAGAGISIVSGLALGIDGCAHRGALDGNGVTYAVLGCGVDICYPKENRRIYDQIQEKGGILSEYPPGRVPQPGYFPQRNRIISGLSDGILVVEARKRSGSLITAELGLEQGRNIYAVPGRPEDVLSEGCNYLIQNGAKLVGTAADIVSDYDFGQKLRLDIGRTQKILLETTEKIVYACLRLEPKHINQIQQESGLEWKEVLSILLKMELKGYAEQVSPDCYVLTQYE